MRIGIRGECLYGCAAHVETILLQSKLEDHLGSNINICVSCVAAAVKAIKKEDKKVTKLRTDLTTTKHIQTYRGSNMDLTTTKHIQTYRGSNMDLTTTKHIQTYRGSNMIKIEPVNVTKLKIL
jgi:hypothetical protein